VRAEGVMGSGRAQLGATKIARRKKETLSLRDMLMRKDEASLGHGDDLVGFYRLATPEIADGDAPGQAVLHMAIMCQHGSSAIHRDAHHFPRMVLAEFDSARPCDRWDPEFWKSIRNRVSPSATRNQFNFPLRTS